MAVTPYATTSAGSNARTFGVAQAIPAAGVLASVVPFSNPEAPHGRIYARLLLTSYPPGATPASAAELLAHTLTTLWSGYVTPGVPGSLPFYPVTVGNTVVADITEGQGGSTTDVITWLLDFREKAESGAPSIYAEAPFTGRGEIFTDSQSPGAGTDTFLQVMAFTIWRLIELRLKVVASAVVATRTFALIRKGKSPGLIATSEFDAAYLKSVTASQTVFFTFRNGAVTENAKDTNAAYPGLSETLLRGLTTGPGDRLAVSSTNLDAGDVETRSECYEEWAGPNP